MGFYWILWASPAQLRYSLSLEFMGLPSTPYFLCFHYFRPAVTHSYFFTSYTAHGLLFLFFWAPLSPFTSSRPICLSHGPVIHYSCCLGLMGFLSICQLFSVRVARPLPSTWASEMAINNCYDFKIYFMQHSWNQTNKIVVLPLWCDMVMQWDACEVQWDVRLNESCKVRCLHPLTVYNALHGLSLASSIICSIINNISSQLQNFHRVEIFHFRKECNKPAHKP